MEKDRIILPVSGFSLADTLDCGQCFRWEEQEDHSFQAVVGKQMARVFQQGDDLIVESKDADEEFWKNYFDLNTDYGMIQEKLSFNKPLRTAMEYTSGIRILNQEPWETLCSFIISQNNNIPRIKGIISRLCENFGEELGEGGYTFPTAERMAELSLEELAPLRAGFRGKYLLDAARKVVSGEVDFARIRESSLEEGQEELRKIYGVGAKVADCVLLFGFHKLDAFPIDTWIKKVLAEYYPNGFPKRAKKYAGVAQQYLFHYIRYYKD